MMARDGRFENREQPLFHVERVALVASVGEPVAVQVPDFLEPAHHAGVTGIPVSVILAEDGNLVR